jgi:tetratricopeptide (TPR) repeat protein
MFYSKILFVFLLMFSPMLLRAQDEAALLIEQMKKAKGTVKIDLLNNISVVYRKSDLSTSLEYARQAFALSAAENYLPGKALALKNEGVCWFFMDNSDSAKICYSQALAVYTKSGDQKGMSACYNNLGLISQETGKYNDALKLYQQSIDIDHKLGDEIGVVTTKANLVDIYIYQGNSKKALQLVNEILPVYQSFSDKEGEIRTLINRAAIYDNLMQPDDALLDLNRAITIARETNDTYYEAMAMSNSGLAIFHKGKPDEALKVLNQVLNMSDDSGEGYDITNTLWIMSEIFASKKEYEKSNDILQKLIKRYEVIDNKREEAKVLTSLGRNLMELNEIDKAMGYLSKSLELTTEINARYELLENYRNLAHAHAILHNFKTADSLQNLFAEIYSGLDNSDSLAGIKKERDKLLTRNSVSKSSASDWIIAFMVLVLILILSVLAFSKKK